MKSDDSIMCEVYCISFIEYMVTGKTLLDYSHLISANGYKKNDKIIYRFGKIKCKLWLGIKINVRNKRLSFRRNKT